MSNWKLKSEEDFEKWAKDSGKELSRCADISYVAIVLRDKWADRAKAAESIAISALDMLEKVKTLLEQTEYAPDTLNEITSLLNQHR